MPTSGAKTQNYNAEEDEMYRSTAFRELYQKSSNKLDQNQLFNQMAAKGFDRETKVEEIRQRE